VLQGKLCTFVCLGLVTHPTVFHEMCLCIMYVSIHVYMYVCMYEYMYVYMYVRTYACRYVCMYAYMYRGADKSLDRTNSRCILFYCEKI
jgi:hypothetical protein